MHILIRQGRVHCLRVSKIMMNLGDFIWYTFSGEENKKQMNSSLQGGIRVVVS